MIFGDGDGTIFNRFTIAVDVMGHELTHGVTDHLAALRVPGPVGGTERVDVRRVRLDGQAADGKGQTAAQADWLIGEGLLAKGINGVALRSMKAPGTAYDDAKLGGKDPQPATMADYVDTDDDDGGVHINSGIPNRAFSLVATAFGGSSWDRAGKIWYAALADPAAEVHGDVHPVRHPHQRAGEGAVRRRRPADGQGGVEGGRHHGSLSRRPGRRRRVRSVAGMVPPASTPRTVTDLVRHETCRSGRGTAVVRPRRRRPLVLDVRRHRRHRGERSCCAARRSATSWRRLTTSPASTTSWAASPTRRFPCRGCSECATTQRSTRRRST